MTYRIKLMFEWGGGCLWCDNDAAFERFGVGAIDDRLPLTPETLARLDQLSVWHDTALNWDNPADHSPWDAEERARFEGAAIAAFEQVRQELGAQFGVVYRPL